MIYPNIRNYREGKRNHYIAPLKDRLEFLGQNALDVRWHRYEPKMNLRKKDNLFEMELVIPGFKKEEIDITIHDDVLKVKAEKTEEKEAADYILKEYDHDLIEKSFVLAHNIGKEKVTADYANGILKIVFIDVPPDKENSRKKVKVA